MYSRKNDNVNVVLDYLIIHLDIISKSNTDARMTSFITKPLMLGTENKSQSEIIRYWTALFDLQTSINALLKSDEVSHKSIGLLVDCHRRVKLMIKGWSNINIWVVSELIEKKNHVHNKYVL